MWTCKNCREEVDERLSECWNCAYSRDGAPPARPIEKVEEVVVKPAPMWRTRASVFSVRIILFMALLSAIDNLLYIPVPQLAVATAQLALFCAFSLLLDLRQRHRSSHQKADGTFVVVDRDNAPVSVGLLLLRSLIVGLMLVFDWGQVIRLISVPAIVSVIATSVPFGFCLYNMWLAVYAPDGLMLHDRLTRSRPALVPVAAPASADDLLLDVSGSKLHRPIVGVAIIAVLTVTVAAFTAFSRFDGQFGALFDQTDTVYDGFAATMEKVVADDTGIRTLVEVETQWYFENVGGSKPAERRLAISVWIPALASSDETQSRVATALLAHLTVQPGYYHSGTLELKTGPTFLSISKTFTITVP